MTKSNIVLVHGAWADGSSWSSVISILQAAEAGYNVHAVQLSLNSLEDDLTSTRRVLNRLSGPTILVGHSYGGAVISGVDLTDTQVTGLVYIAAFAPEGESLVDINGKFTTPPSATTITPDKDGYLWLNTDTFGQMFAADVAPDHARIMAAVQKPIASEGFVAKAQRTNWRKLPSWYLVCEADLMINPDAERWMAERSGSTTRSLPGASHVPMVANPQVVADLILEAAAKIPAGSGAL